MSHRRSRALADFSKIVVISTSRRRLSPKHRHLCWLWRKPCLYSTLVLTKISSRSLIGSSSGPPSCKKDPTIETLSWTPKQATKRITCIARVSSICRALQSQNRLWSLSIRWRQMRVRSIAVAERETINHPLPLQSNPSTKSHQQSHRLKSRNRRNDMKILKQIGLSKITCRAS